MGVEGNQAMVASVAAVAMATAMAMAMVTGALQQYFFFGVWMACSCAVTEQKSVYVYRGFSIIAMSALK